MCCQYRQRFRLALALSVLSVSATTWAAEPPVVRTRAGTRLIIETRSHLPYASNRVVPVSYSSASEWRDEMIDQYEDSSGMRLGQKQDSSRMRPSHGQNPLATRIARKHWDRTSRNYDNLGYPPPKETRICYGQCVCGWFRYIRGQGPAIWVRN